jgi:cell division protein FtsI (penicillin-binding protein 3)
MDVSVAVNPKHVGKNSAVIAKAMSKITGKPARRFLAKMKKKSGFEWLARRLPPQVVVDHGLDTLRTVQLIVEPRRIYHMENVAGQLFGTTNTENTGIAGLELQYDGALSGEEGFIVYARDGRQNEMPSVDYPRIEPVAGHDLVLTIDLWLQQLAERELEKGVAESEAEGGIVVMMDPRTGEVLTMAQYPRVNPATFGKSPRVHQKLRAVTDMFEPGSVFKIVTASAAMEYNLIPSEQEFYAENGVFKVPIGRGKRFRTIRDVHKYGILTFREAIEFSSNIVMVKASDIIGNEKLYLTARDYGFGMPTNIDMPGEIGGLMRKPSEWSGLSRHSFSYGYEVGVTPIQIAAAYAAVANGGTLMKPFIVKRELDAGGTVVRETEPQKIRRVVSEETAAELSSFLEGVVVRGTASAARIEGLRIAGKTGTSKRVVDGSYRGKDYTASFVGYFPAEDPRLLCLVMLDNPRGINYYGGTTSAPIFHSIVQRIITTSDRYGQAAPLPRAEGISSPGRSTMKPTARTSSKNKRRTGSVLPARNPGHVVPDVRGYSLRKAIGILLDEKFKTKVHGSGMVVSQSPGPGEPVKTGMVVTLTCQPKSVDFDGMQ